MQVSSSKKYFEQMKEQITVKKFKLHSFSSDFFKGEGEEDY